jgi:hypothetical protein
MSILKKAMAHFDEQGMKEIKVPEWDSIIYATPLTLSEKRTLVKFSKGDGVEFSVRFLIMKALDKSGKKIFDINDKGTLLGHAHAGVIERIVDEIADAVKIEEVEEK